MKVTIPEYYKKFHCTADKCRHNCCEGGWLIELGDDTVRAYEKLEGAFGEELRSSLMKDEQGSWCFRLKDGRCPHLNADGLCRVCMELGEKGMGVVCREFPRFSLYLGNEKEMGVGLGCEEAARLLLENDQPFRLIFEEAPDETIWENQPEAADVELPEEEWIKLLRTARKKIFAWIWDTSRSFEENIVRVLEFSKQLQNIVNDEDMDAVKEFLDTYESGTEMKTLCEADAYDCGDMSELLADIFDSLEILEQGWTKRMEAVRTILEKGSAFLCYEKAEQGRRLQSQLLSYFIYRYFMKAAYDYNVSDKIRFGICCYIILSALFSDRCEKNGGVLSVADMVEEARVFSRQVEYSEENVEAVCEELNFGDELSEERLKALIQMLQTASIHKD
jgi:lysine-N-methylase